MLILSSSTAKVLIYISAAATLVPATGLSGTTGLKFIKPDGSLATPTNGLTELDSTNAKGWYSVTLAAGDTLVTGEWVLSYQTATTAANIGITRFMVNAQIAQPIQKNTALTTFPFLMTDATTHVPATGKTVTCTRAIDSGAFGAGTLANVTEKANGVYTVDFAAADLNGSSIVLRATATGCDDTLVVLNPAS